MRLRFAIAIIILFLAGEASGETVLNFPRVISTSLTFTGMAVSNPTPAEASITFAAFQPDGSLLTQAGLQNPLTVTIPAGGQYARLASEIFPVSGSFNGWIQATSASAGLTGFFLNSNTAVTDFDGSATGVPSADFILPIASEDGQSQTELTILNVNTEPAAITVTLYAVDGSVIATKSVTLGGRNLLRQTLQPIFGAVPLSGASHIRVLSDRPVVGEEVVADFQIPQIALRRETIAIAGQPATAAQIYTLPQFVSGGGWASYLSVVNGSGLSQDITLTAYQEDGTPWKLPTNPKKISVPGNGSFKDTVEDAFGVPAGQMSTGWISVVSSLGFVISDIAYGNVQTPSFAAVPGVDVAQASKFNVYSQVAEGGGFFTGLALVNPGGQPANVEFYTMRPDGTTVGKSTFTVGANQRVGKLFRELLPATFDQVAGWAFLRSSQPVIGAVLFGSANGLALANVPAQTPVSDFIPPAQRTAAITGTIHQDAIGAAGATVTLSGPVGASMTTDSSGLFAFTQLPAGQYTVSVTMAGAQFFPAQRAVTIALSNVDGTDFDAVGLAPADAPAISFLTPSSIFGGNSTFNITVLGSNFNQTSTVMMGGQPLPTSFVSATELHAPVPPALLQNSGALAVTVQTPPPGGGTSNSATLTVTVLPGSPLIGGRTTVGEFPAGVAIDPARRIALVTSEKENSVRIIDLNNLQTVANVNVGRSPAEGIAVDVDGDQALVGNAGDDNVSVIDLKTSRVIKTIAVQKFPTGIAINPNTRRAFVANGESDSVSIIDLNSLSVVATIASVGKTPASVAVNPITNFAIVTNRNGNDVTIIDLASNTIAGSVPVGLYPRGVAVNSRNNTAVVANANSSTVTIVDLASLKALATIPVGVGPTGVAIHAGTNTAIVTNSGEMQGTAAAGSPNTVSLISLDQQKVVATVPVGGGAFGVDVEPEMQEAVVANFNSNDIAVVRFPNPMPLVNDVEPKTFPAAGAFTITVTGSGFLPTSVVTLNGQSLPTTFISSTELQAQVTAAVLQQLLQPSSVQAADAGKNGTVFNAVTPVTFDVGVSNPGPGGGNSPPPADPTVTHIQPQNLAPVLVSMDPTQISVTASELHLTVSGNNFNAASTVNFGGAPHSPSALSAGSMTVVISSSELKAGPVLVSVTNPAPGGGTSSALNFTVTDRDNPAPSIASVTPTELAAGSNATAVRITGSGFITAAVVSVEGGAIQTAITPTSIDLTIPAVLLQNAGILHGLVANLAPGGGSATFNISVLNPAPVVTNLTPQTATGGIASLDLHVVGSRFLSSSVVTIEGTPVPTLFVSSQELQGTLSGAILARAGRLHIGVTNPSPGGGAADAGFLTLAPGVPRLDSINPQGLRADQAGTVLSLNGSNFADGATALFGGIELPATLVGPSQLRVILTAPMLLGTSSVKVKNPGPGGTSAGVDFAVTSLVPAITEVRPSSTASGQTITVAGTNFGRGSQVMIGGVPSVTTAVSDTQLTVVVPTGVPGGTTTLTVVNPAPGGGTSNQASIQLSSTVAAITGVSPPTVRLDQTGTTVTVTGHGFASLATVQVDGTAVKTAFVNDTTLTFALPLLARAGTVNITVLNPPPGGGVSAPFVLNVQNSVPVLTAVSPASGFAGSNVDLTVTGTGFVQDSKISFSGQPVNTKFVNSTTVTASVPLLTVGGQLVLVTNPAPGGGPSNSLNFVTSAALNPVPVISSVSPSFVGAGSAAPVEIRGSGFVNGAAVSLDGAMLSGITIASSASIFATLPPLAAGNHTIAVSNPAPGGGASNGFFITSVTAPMITSISPAIVAPGSSSFTMTIYGANFGAVAPAVTISVGSTILNPLSVTPGQVTLSIPATLLGSETTYSLALGVNGVPTNAVSLQVRPSDTFASGIGAPNDVVVNAGKELFVSNADDGSIIRISPLGVVTTVATGFSTGSKSLTIDRGGPTGLAISPAGDLYVADNAAGTISVVSSTTSTLFATGLSRPNDILFDQSGNLLVANSGDGTIRKVTPAGTVMVYATISGANPTGLALSPTGTLYVSDFSTGTIYKITLGGESVLPFASMNKFSDGLALDAAGNLYVANGAQSTIHRIEPDGRVALVSSGVLSGPSGLAFGADGILYASANFSGSVFRFPANVAVSPAAGPFVSRIEPGFGAPGTTFQAHILGSGLSGANTVTFSSAVVTAVVQPGGSNTSVPVTVTVLPAAVPGALTFTTAVPGGITNAASFSVDGSPAVTSLSPGFATEGADDFTLVVTGNNFNSDATINFGSGVLIPSSITSTEIHVTVPTSSVASIRTVNVGVSTASASSNALPFEIRTPVSTIEITPASATLGAIGASQAFTAVARNTSGAVIDGKVFHWASSAAAAATIDESTGLATSAGNGVTTITATVDGVSQSVSLTVAQTAASVAVTPAPASLSSVGATLQLTPTVKDSRGVSISGKTITWISDASAIATVDANGLITAVANGTANIKASVDGVIGSARLTVSQVAASVDVSPSSKTLNAINSTQVFTTTIRDSSGNIIPGKTVVWSSDTASIATIDPVTGTATALTNGSAGIRATVDGVSGSASLVVSQTVAAVTVDSASSISLSSIGATRQFNATPKDGNGVAVAGRTAIWAAEDTTIATVGSSGVATSVGNGTTSVKATVDGVTGSASLTVSQVVASVQVTPSSKTLVSLGDTQQFSATPKDANGNTVAGKTATWALAASGTAAIDSTGTTTAVTNGSATVRATVDTIVGTASLTIAQAPASVDVAPVSRTFASLTDSQQFTATLKDARGNVIAGQPVIWSSDNTSTSTVDGNGVATAMAGGSATIKATAGTASGTASVIVAQVTASVTISPAARTLLSFGDAQQFTAAPLDAKGKPISGKTVIWTSAAGSVATVDATGLATAISNGTTAIQATVEGVVSNTAILTVTQAAVVISVTPAAKTILSVGDTQQFSATVKDAKTNVIASNAIVWSSDNTAVATVDAGTGLATAGSTNGTANIKATIGALAGSAALTVAQAAATVVVSPSTLRLTSLGDTSPAFTVTVRDARGNTLTGHAVTWSSSATGIATVNGSGVATAVSNGTAQIQATVDGVTGAATVTVAQETDSVELDIDNSGGVLAAQIRTFAMSGSGGTGSSNVFRATGTTPTLTAFGATQRFLVRPMDHRGNPITGRTAVWSSDTVAVATIDANGVATAIGNGSTLIHATVEGKSGSITLNVGQAVAAVQVSPGSASAGAIGGTQQFTATVKDARGNTVQGKAVTWSSLSTAIVNVDSASGLATAVANGSTTVRAAVDGVTGLATFSVGQTTAIVEVTPGNIGFAALGANNTQTLVAIAKDTTAHSISGKAFTWTSDNSAVAAVNASGVVTAVANGTVMVHATVDGITGNARVTVAQGVSRIDIAPGNSTLSAFHSTQQFSAVLRDANGNLVSGAVFTWSSSNSSVATIDSSGLASAVGNGTVTITATSGAATSTATLRVAQSVHHITVSDPGGGSISAFGRTRGFGASARDANDFVIVGKIIGWSSLTTGLADVDSNGTATARGNGHATVRASVDGVFSDIAFDIAQVLDHIDLAAQDSGSIRALNRKRQFNAIARDAGGSAISGRVATWLSLAAGIADIDSTGVATAHGNGSTTIRATIDGIVSELTLSVDQLVDHIDLLPGGSGSIPALNRVRGHSATPRDPDGYAIAGKTVIWSTSAGAIATIDGNGNAVAKGNGRALIRATVDSVFAEVALDIQQMTQTVQVSADGTGSIPALTRNRHFSALAMDPDGFPIPGKLATWASLSTGVADVDSNGVATARGNGHATIRAIIDGISVDNALDVQQITNLVSVTTLESGSIRALNRKRQFAAVALDAAGIAISGKVPTWQATNVAVAIVDLTGVATAHGNGHGTVRATIDSVIGEASVDVDQLVTTLTIGADGSGSIPALNRHRGFSANLKDPDGFAITGKTIVWSSSSSTIAVIDSASGAATAKGNGRAMIRATVDSVFVEVPMDIQQTTAGVQVSGDTSSIPALNRHRALTAFALDPDGSPIAGKTAIWASLTTTVTTVDVSGSVTAKGNGHGIIHATIDGFTAEARLDVLQVTGTVSVTSSSTGSLPALGRRRQFNAIALDLDGSPISGKTPSWSAPDSGIADVDTAGFATARGNGHARIRAVIDGITGEGDLDISQVTTTVRVTSSGSGSIPALNRTRQFTAAVFDPDGNAITGKIAAWISTDSTTATVSSTTGLATAKNNGSIKIRATVDGIIGETSLDISQVTTTVVISSTDSASIPALNRTRQHTAAAKDPDGNLILSKTFSWASSSSGVAAVDSTGRATAKGNGHASITATVDGISGSLGLDVSQVVGAVVVSPSSAKVKLNSAGQDLAFTATVRDLDGSLISGKTVSWNSSDSTIADLDSNGKGHGHKHGSVSVKAKADGVEGAATLNVD